MSENTTNIVKCMNDDVLYTYARTQTRRYTKENHKKIRYFFFFSSFFSIFSLVESSVTNLQVVDVDFSMRIFLLNSKAKFVFF